MLTVGEKKRIKEMTIDQIDSAMVAVVNRIMQARTPKQRKAPYEYREALKAEKTRRGLLK